MKVCAKCRLNKAFTEFNFKIKTKNTYSPYCKNCSRIYTRTHYLNNKDYSLLKAKARNNKIRTEIKKFIRDYLSDNSCVDCGQSDPLVPEFDHINNDKLFNISEMAREKHSLLKIIEEIKSVK